jgi:hypothetical protein
MGDSDAHSYDSSPDPLAISFNNNKPTRKATPRRPLGSTSPSKQNRRSSVSEFEFSSPTKAMILNTPRVGSASPWRIKVTVQAEPGSDDENAQSPTVGRFTRTQTTTIPLKDPDASSPVKRGRGRPRKSDTGVVSRTKRAGTPIKRAPRSKSRDRSVGAADASAADVDTDAPPKRKRGRPRKSVQPPVQDDDIVMTLDHSEPHREVTPVPAAKPKTSASQKSTRFATPEEPMSDAQTTGRRKPPAEYEIPVVDTPAQTKLGNQLRARKGTPHAKKIVPIALSSDEDEESEQESDVLTPTSGEEESPEEVMGDPFTSVPVPENTQRSSSQQPDMFEHSRADIHVPVVQVESYSGDPYEDDDDEPQDVTQFAFDEGTTRMVDDTTVIDSENFSMISVDSLPSSGGLTSPPKPEDVGESAPQIGSMLRHEYLQPSVANATGSDAQDISTSLEVPRTSPGLAPNGGPSRPVFRRYVTPVIDAEVPSMPPIIEPTQPGQPKTETPRLGRVVTAGVALQGVLDPSRLTPEPTQKMIDEKRDRLDDLFRGFSEGTRRELQAGLRLGEQLAETGSKASSPRAPSSPIKSQPDPVAAPKSAVFKTHRKIREPRLLTPEDQDDFVVTAAPVEVEDVEYPPLPAPTEKSLPSPDRSDDEDEMSWRVDTPPKTTGNTERLRLGNIDGPSEQPLHIAATSTAAQFITHTRQEDYSDIWQEEASRSSDSIEADVAQAEDLFLPSPAAPARGKPPRKWRQKLATQIQHSNETESLQQRTSARLEPEAKASVETYGNEEPATEDDDAGSDASDDTGMFFQSNMPNVFSKRDSRDMKQKKAEKLDLTMLLNEGESLAPESSPPVVANKIPAATNTNPFLNTPPRFPGYLSSPHKSSPLRREIRGSDISSEGPSRLFQEESSLPLPQSSPFHTIVDGESKLSIASDQRQLQMEMEGVTDSSICRVRNEADGYLDAYEPQERSLDEIEEVTEPSRTWLMKHSSPPRMKTLSPVRKRVSLFRDTPEKPRAAPRMHIEVETVEKRVLNAEKEVEPSSSAQPTAVVTPPEGTPEERPTGLLTRMTSTLWSAVSKPAVSATPASSPPSPHPILAKLSALPKIEPWTKTHYKTLDKLYSVNQKHPALFSPSITPATPLSRTNAHLLNKFRSNNKQPYVGAVFSAWGYEFDMTEELVVLCQVFCELMSLDSIAAYEKLKGREIELGECMPGKTGDAIEADEVMRRLATVILGEEVREDEKNGVKIDRSRGLEVHWPQGVGKRV